jgi:dolichyl-phosphooligosaccharide-protein glycotransferase
MTEEKKEDAIKEEDEKIEIDWKLWKEKLKKTAKFSAKYSVILVLLLVIILQYLPNSEGKMPWGGIYMRGLTEEMPQTERWARENVNTFYKNQIKQIVDQEYPNLPETNKQEVLEDKWKEFQTQNKAQIDQQVQATREQLLSHFQYEHEGKKYLYMPDIDPYYFLRKARNIIETGEPCDTVKNGQPWDTHMIAPLGVRCGGNEHGYVLALIYKTNKIFNKNIDLMQAAGKFSIIMIFFSIILAYFIGLKIAGKTGGFFSALLIGILPAIFSRTPWGHTDTDAYNIFFPLLAIFTFFMALDAKKTRDKIIWGITTGIVFLIYSMFWEWWFIFDAILAGIGIWIIIEIIKAIKTKKFTNLKQATTPIASFFLSTAILITIFQGFTRFLIFLTGPLKGTTIKAAAHTSLWPNVYTTVAELSTGSMTKIYQAIGGKLLFAIAITGIILAIFLKNKKKSRNIKLAAILTIWFIISIYASLKGVRFMILLGPAFAIAFGVGAGLIITKLSEFGKKSLGINKIITATLLILLFGVIIATSGIAKTSYNMATNSAPIINDAWYNSLTHIKENSQKDAIVNSWWDYGHHFKYFADRAVTFDGGSQNTPMAHWIGRVLATKDENEAVGILRMLDCGSNTAFEKINEEVNDTPKTIDIIYKITKSNKTEAKKILEEKNIKNTEEILKYTHCEPPENFFITSGDMIGKAGVWAHFGLWDFIKADMWVNMRRYNKNNFIDNVTEKYNLTEEKAATYYNELQSITSENEANLWISPTPGYPSQIIACEEKNNIINCGGIEIDIMKKKVTLQTQQGTGIPHSLAYFTLDKELKEEKQENSNMLISVLLIPTKDRRYNALLVSPELSTSIFTRLYYLDGHGLKHFNKVYSDRELTHGEIYIWKVDWEGGEENILTSLIPKTTIKQGDQITINYIGWLDDYTIFDSSILDWQNKSITKETKFEEYETIPLSFIAGSGQLIQGFEETLIGMRKGEEKIIAIPPEKAYGTDTEVHFLANKTLNFKIKVEQIV